jgi:hypothetical protein
LFIPLFCYLSKGFYLKFCRFIENTMLYKKLFLIIIIIIVSKFTYFCTKEQPAYLNPAEIIINPGEEYSGSSRNFQGIPSLERAPEGRLWAVWYGGKGKGEDSLNYVILVTSGDDGKTWSKEKVVIDPDKEGPVRAFDPELWLDPNGRLWVFWAQTIGHDGSIAGVWTITTDDPDSNTPKWSAPRRLTNGVMMCKPFVLSSGEWVLPVSTWRNTDKSAKMVVSTNQGQTWNIRGACNIPEQVRSYDEHIIIERKDGTLWMLVRTKYGIGQSTSRDRGKTWSPLTPSSIQHPSARFFIRRLNSGKLLLVKHGPINEKTGRELLTAFLSDDDGLNWYGGLMLDERKGISYPDGVQAPDGTIYIIYDYSRTGEKEILMAKFKEDDIIKGSCISEKCSLRITVNKAL